MPLTAWRIVKAKYAASAFAGEGARINGGRWNSPGVPLVYTADSTALAALEMLVQLERQPILGAYVLIGCTFDEKLVTRLDRRTLPDHSRTYPAPSELRAIGDAWFNAAPSPVLHVPSAVVATDTNYLLNPRHPEFRAIRILEPQPFEFDLRLLYPPRQ